MNRTLYFLVALALLMALGCSETPTAPDAAQNDLQSFQASPGDLQDVQNPNAVESHPDARCPHGFFEGKWVQDTANVDQGHFLGRWTDRTGATTGILSGRFWTTDDGQRLYEGNVSGVVTDQIIALVHGVWYYDDARLCPVCGQGHGVLHGRVKFVESDRHGVMRGVFGDYELSPFERTLPMKGAWTLRCRDLSPIDVAIPSE
jgi:hypothetical protein